MHINDPLHLVLGQVGQRDVVAEQKGQAAVVVLEIQRLAHAGRQLVDKAEDAFVAAGMLAVHQIGFKFQPQLFVLFFADLHTAARAVVVHFQHQLGFHHIKPVVQHIHDLVSVDAAKLHPPTQLFARRRAVRLDRLYRHRHAISPFGQNTKNRGHSPYCKAAPSIFTFSAIIRLLF